MARRQRPAQRCCMEPVRRASTSPARRGEEPGAGFRPVGFLDDDPGLAGQVVADLAVFGGLESLEGAVNTTGADTLLITMPRATGAAVRRVVEAALALNLDVRTVPSLADLLDGTVNAYRVRRVQVEDLLRRPMVTERPRRRGTLPRPHGRDHGRWWLNRF